MWPKPDKNDPLKIQRSMALMAFYFLMGLPIVILLMCWFGGEHVGANLNSASGILIVILPCFVSLVLAFGVKNHLNEMSEKSDNG